MNDRWRTIAYVTVLLSMATALVWGIASNGPPPP